MSKVLDEMLESIEASKPDTPDVELSQEFVDSMCDLDFEAVERALGTVVLDADATVNALLDRIAALESALSALVGYVRRVGGYMTHEDQVVLWRARSLLQERAGQSALSGTPEVESCGTGQADAPEVIGGDSGR